jgi:hypothetical protein
LDSPVLEIWGKGRGVKGYEVRQILKMYYTRYTILYFDSYRKVVKLARQKQIQRDHAGKETRLYDTFKKSSMMSFSVRRDFKLNTYLGTALNFSFKTSSEHNKLPVRGEKRSAVGAKNVYNMQIKPSNK